MEEEQQQSAPMGFRQQMAWLWHFIQHHPPVMYTLIGLVAVIVLFKVFKYISGKPLRDLEKKAQAGDIETALNLALAFHTGEDGAPQDYRRAARYYRLAAEAGKAEAQAGLGALYYAGLGMKQDYAEAAKWNTLAARQDNAQGQSYLALLHFKGLGMPQNPERAYFFVVLAMKPRENGKSMSSQPSFVNFAKQVAQSLSPAQKEDIKKRALEWKPKTDQKEA